MINYNIKKIDNSTNNYDKYIINLSNGKSCYYYENLNNQFVNVIEIMFTNSQIINKFENNKIYLFFDNITNLEDIKTFIAAFNIEFSNLKFRFIINNQEERKLAEKIIKALKIDSDIIDSSKYYQNKFEKKVTNITQYQDYNLEDNPFLKNDEETAKIDQEKLEEYANYNGYNERLIDVNVKNIVSIRNNKNKFNNE